METNAVKDDPEMEVLVDNISDLASKVLEIFGKTSFALFNSCVKVSFQNRLPQKPPMRHSMTVTTLTLFHSSCVTKRIKP